MHVHSSILEILTMVFTGNLNVKKFICMIQMANLTILSMLMTLVVFLLMELIK